MEPGSLSKARARKAARNKDIGEPIPVASKIIKAVIRGNAAWTAESAHIARKVDLEVTAGTFPYRCPARVTLLIPFGTTTCLQDR